MGPSPRHGGLECGRACIEVLHGDADVQRAPRKLAQTLDAVGIPYAIAGAMALNAHGYERMSPRRSLGDPRGFAALKARVLGLGYVLD